MHSQLILVLMMVPLVALGKLQGTQQILFGCAVTRYRDVWYQRDHITSDYSVDSFEACIEKCLTTPDCKAINLERRYCALLRSGIEKADKAIMWTDYNQRTDGEHAIISCQPAASGPVGCGKQAPTHLPTMAKAGRIIGGNVARPHSWPWQVSLTAEIASNRKSQTCGASLIRVKDNVEESDILVTAAHCVICADISTNPVLCEPAKVVAIAGKHQLDKNELGEQNRKAVQLLMHPDFEVNHNDVALVKLDKAINFTDTIRPICLPAQDEALPVGKNCAVAGWGRISKTTSASSKTLKQLAVAVQSAADCESNARGGWGATYVEDEMVCAGSLKGDKGICEGDSGGMLACQRDNGGWTLYGVASFAFGSGCLQAGKPGIFARVSNYADWITENAAAMTSL